MNPMTWIRTATIMGFLWDKEAALIAQLVKNLPAMSETWVQSLSWEDPLEKGKATLPTPVFCHGEFHGLYSPWGRKKSDMTERLFHFHGIEDYAVLKPQGAGSDKGGKWAECPKTQQSPAVVSRTGRPQRADPLMRRAK